MVNKADKKEANFIDYVENLNEEVKTLALNMAIYLAKTKSSSTELSRLEPEFIKLVNGTVKVVHELTQIINAAKNKEVMTYDVPSGKMESDRMETRLKAILEQCRQILESLGGKP